MERIIKSHLAFLMEVRENEYLTEDETANNEPRMSVLKAFFMANGLNFVLVLTSISTST